jgi:hypothetical protein
MPWSEVTDYMVTFFIIGVLTKLIWLFRNCVICLFMSRSHDVAVTEQKVSIFIYVCKNVSTKHIFVPYQVLITDM